MYGREYIPQNAADLTRLALAVVKHYTNVRTLTFALSTIVRASRLAAHTSGREHAR
jgi:hypothetical protein